MISACTITRAGTPTVDPATGQMTGGTTTLYTGKCEIQFAGTQSGLKTPQGQQVAVQQPLLKLPVDGTAGVKTGDDVTLTVHPEDTGKVGMRLRVIGDFTRTYATARRLPVESES